MTADSVTLKRPQKMPGQPLHPVLGWRPASWAFVRDPVGHLTATYKQYGKLCSMVESNEDHPATVCAFGPEYNQVILSQAGLFYVQPWITGKDENSSLAHLGIGLVNINGENHKQQRRMIMPAFHKKRLDLYRDVMVTATQQVIDRWESGKVYDISRQLDYIATGAVTKALFGDSQSSDVGEITDEFKRLVEMYLASAWLPVDLPFLPYGRLLKLANGLEQKILAIITERRASGAGAQEVGNDVLSMLIQARDEDGTRLSDSQLVGHVNVLFTAGHDTTTSALTWTLFLLAQHPTIAVDLVDELTSVLHGEAPTTQQLNELPLLDRVLSESLRILPPATYTTRRAVDEFDLGPYHLPARTLLVISNYVTQHMPELYEAPNNFWPDRWLTISPSPYEYLPFGVSTHMCIGSGFALMEMKIVLSMILQRYRFSVVPNSQVDRKQIAAMAPKQGMPMVVYKQDRQFVANPVKGNVHEMVNLAVKP